MDWNSANVLVLVHPKDFKYLKVEAYIIGSQCSLSRHLLDCINFVEEDDQGKYIITPVSGREQNAVLVVRALHWLNIPTLVSVIEVDLWLLLKLICGCWS